MPIELNSLVNLMGIFFIVMAAVGFHYSSFYLICV